MRLTLFNAQTSAAKQLGPEYAIKSELEAESEIWATVLQSTHIHQISSQPHYSIDIYLCSEKSLKGKESPS